MLNVMMLSILMLKIFIPTAITLSIIILNVSKAECHHAVSLYPDLHIMMCVILLIVSMADCHYAEYHNAACCYI